jgi:hypothetical protein
VIGHDAIGGETHRDFFEALCDDFFEDVEVGKSAENILFAVGAVQDMINNIARRLSSCSRHSGVLSSRFIYVNAKRIK